MTENGCYVISAPRIVGSFRAGGQGQIYWGEY